MIRVILARHGVTTWNEGGRYQGHQDVPLADDGRLQAQRLGMRLRDTPITLAYSSDLCRARETAEIALEGRDVPIVTTPALREMCFGMWEGLRHDEIALRFAPEWGTWTVAPATTCPPGGHETLQGVRDRVRGFFRAAVGDAPHPSPAHDWFSYRAAGEAARPEDGRTLLFVAHGGPIRLLLADLFQMPTAAYWQFAVRPASVSLLDVYPEGAIAEVIGDTSHVLCSS
ncbi:MAG: hypothetical protein GEU73_00785 [Chloroflexi bacterium]|nr:hypothetical protein [Chloroflexota bacterium]